MLASDHDFIRPATLQSSATTLQQRARPIQFDELSSIIDHTLQAAVELSLAAGPLTERFMFRA
jgi:hypothetical protein